MNLLSLLVFLIFGEAALAQTPRLSSKVPVNPLEPIGDWVWGKLINGFVYRARSSYGGNGGAVIGVSSSPRTRTGSDNAGSSLPTTGQVLATDKRFSTLLLALEIAFGNETGLDPPFTVFAPTAQAFNKLNNSTLTALLQNPEELAQVLLRHIIPGEAVRIPAGDISLTTASGDSIK